MLTTNYKPAVDTQKIKRRKSKNATMESHQFRKKGQQERGKKKKQGNYKRARHNMIPLVSPYL